MTEHKLLVLDARILLRAVFGIRVLTLLETYEDSVSFYTPDICFSDALKYVPIITATHQLDPSPGLLVLTSTKLPYKTTSRTEAGKSGCDCPKEKLSSAE